MLKVALPRPSFDAVTRGDGRAPLRPAFDDDADWLAYEPMTRSQAEAFRRDHPALSPWKVIAAQLALGAAAASFAWLVAGSIGALSAAYGAAVVVVPGTLMARGATSRLSSLSPVTSALSVLGWGFVKMALSVAMLVLAARIVPGLVWPALLASMVLCMQSYWFALLWRVPAAENAER
ncbi:MAG: ATP synthase subunit I [Pseudomonadota bacterium]|nr:ATP synthase subunit I [Pseudomonadota bacterium]